MSKSLVLIACGCVVVVCLACIGFAVMLGGGVYFMTKPVADAGDSYLEAIKAGDYNRAYEMSASNIHNEMGSVEGLQTFFSQNNFSPDSWSFNNRSVDNNTGSLGGTATMTNGVKVNLEMSLIKVDGEWKISGIHFEEL